VGEIDPQGNRRVGLDAFLNEKVEEGYAIETRTETHAIISRRPKGLRRFTSAGRAGRTGTGVTLVLPEQRLEVCRLAGGRSRACVRSLRDRDSARRAEKADAPPTLSSARLRLPPPTTPALALALLTTRRDTKATTQEA
jgi:hypothetical protein